MWACVAQQKGMGLVSRHWDLQVRFRSPFSSKVVVHGHCFVPPPPPIKMAHIAACIRADTFWHGLVMLGIVCHINHARLGNSDLHRQTRNQRKHGNGIFPNCDLDKDGALVFSLWSLRCDHVVTVGATGDGGGQRWGGGTRLKRCCQAYWGGGRWQNVPRHHEEMIFSTAPVLLGWFLLSDVL